MIVTLRRQSLTSVTAFGIIVGGSKQQADLLGDTSSNNAAINNLIDILVPKAEPTAATNSTTPIATSTSSTRTTTTSTTTIEVVCLSAKDADILIAHIFRNCDQAKRKTKKYFCILCCVVCVIDYIFSVIVLSSDYDVAFALAQAANSDGLRWFWSNGVLKNGQLNGFDAPTIREAIFELFSNGIRGETRLKLFGMFVDYAGSDRALAVCPSMHKSTLMNKAIF